MRTVQYCDNFVRKEAAADEFDLTACLSLIEYVRMTKDCDGREPVPFPVTRDPGRFE
jgi:hypothetical protein